MQLQLQATIAFHFTFIYTHLQRWEDSTMAQEALARLSQSLDFVRDHHTKRRWRRGEANKMDPRYALPRRRRSLQRRRFPRIHLTLRLGFSRHRAMYRVVGSGSSMVSHIPRRRTEADKQDMEGQQLRQTQGHLHNRHIDPRWWSESTTNPNEELDLHHFLRSRSNLRSHYEHCLLGEDGECFGAWDIQCWKLLHGICAVLVRTAGRSV